MLAHAGTRALGEAVEQNVACANHLADVVRRSADFELMAAGISIVCFRYWRAGEHELDALNEAIMMCVQESGTSYLSGARVGGRFALRACVLNFRTTEAGVEALVDDCRRAGAALARPAERPVRPHGR